MKYIRSFNESIIKSDIDDINDVFDFYADKWNLSRHKYSEIRYSLSSVYSITDTLTKGVNLYEYPRSVSDIDPSKVLLFIRFSKNDNDDEVNSDVIEFVKRLESIGYKSDIRKDGESYSIIITNKTLTIEEVESLFMSVSDKLNLKKSNGTAINTYNIYYSYHNNIQAGDGRDYITLIISLPLIAYNLFGKFRQTKEFKSISDDINVFIDSLSEKGYQYSVRIDSGAILDDNAKTKIIITICD